MLNRNENSNKTAFTAYGDNFYIYGYVRINGTVPLLQIGLFRYYTS